jgi:hypothetical protein
LIVLHQPAHAAPFDDGILWPIANIKLTYPQIASLELGMAFQVFPWGNNFQHGFAVSAAPGVTGITLNAGYSIFLWALYCPYIWRFEPSAYYSWLTDSWAFGGNVTVGFWFVSGTLGGYYDLKSKGLLLHAGIGFGFI